MELASAEGAVFRVDVIDGVEVDRVETDFGAVPVGGRFFDDDAGVEGPFFEDEGAAGNEEAGAGPLGAAVEGIADGGDRAHVDGAPRGVEEDLQEVGGGVSQGCDEGVGVARGGTDGGEIGRLAFVERFGAAQNVEEVSVVGRE